MDSTTTDVVLVVLFLLGMALFGLAMLGVALRTGPKRGFWNQPAAALRRPGGRVVFGLYVFAAVQFLLGLGITVFVEPHSIGVLLVCTAMAAIYVLFAFSYQLAHRTARAADRRRARRAAAS